MVNRDEPRHRCSLQLSPYIKPEHIRSDDPWRDLCRQATGAVVHGSPPCCKNGTFFEQISHVRNRHSGGYGVGLRMNVGLPSVSVMKHRERQHPLSQRRAFAPVIAVCCAVLGAFVVGFSIHPAHALPSFARQTGQPCGTCHTDLPALTPFGRRSYSQKA